MVASFQDCNVNGSPGGLLTLCQRLVSAIGIKPLVIHYSDVAPEKKKLDTVKCLEQKLKDLLTAC